MNFKINQHFIIHMYDIFVYVNNIVVQNHFFIEISQYSYQMKVLCQYIQSSSLIKGCFFFSYKIILEKLKQNHKSFMAILLINNTKICKKLTL